MAILESPTQPIGQGESAMPGDSQGAHALVWILAGGIVVRLALWFAWADLPVRIVDAQDYDRLATGLVETGSYIDPNGNLSSLRPPGYPAVVAVIYRISGIGNHAAVRLFQSVLSLVTVICAYFLGRELFSRQVGLWAAAGVCFYPSLLGFNNLILSEMLFTLAVTAVSLTTVLAVKRESLGWLIATGVLLGLGAYVRSILWLFTPILSLYLFIVWPGGSGKRAILAAVPFVTFVAILVPWAIRNTRLHKTFTLVDVMGGRNAMMGNYEHTPLERNWATISIVKGDKEWFRVLQAETPDYSELTQGQKDKVAMRHGIRFALAHPLLTIQRDAVRFFNFWQLERTLVAGAREGFFGEIPTIVLLPAAAVICGGYAVVLFAGIFGMVFAGPTDRRIHWFLVLTIVYPCLIHTLIFAHSRYHLPVMPIVVLFAAAAWVNRRAIWEQRRTWSFRLATAACCLFVLGWLREIIFVDLQKMSGMIG